MYYDDGIYFRGHVPQRLHVVILVLRYVGVMELSGQGSLPESLPPCSKRANNALHLDMSSEVHANHTAEIQLGFLTAQTLGPCTSLSILRAPDVTL